MKCQACERADHDNCGMQSWCDCDCEGYDPYMPFGHYYVDDLDGGCLVEKEEPMEHVRLVLGIDEEFDAALRGPDVLQDRGDLSIITKDHGTVGGRPIVLLTFTVRLPDGREMKAQTVTTLGNFMSAAAGLRGRYGEPPY